MQPTERGVNPHINHIIENSGNFINFFAHKEHEKEQIEYSYFELEKVFGARKARFINKLNYWLNKCGRNIEGCENKWIYNTLKDWAEQFNWSVSTLKRKFIAKNAPTIHNAVDKGKFIVISWPRLLPITS